MKFRKRDLPTLADDPTIQELVDLFNGMLAVAQSAVADYNAMREDLRAALGDLTVDAQPFTKPLGGQDIGTLGAPFNRMLATAQGGLESGGMVTEIGALAAQVETSSHELSASAQQTGTAITEIADTVGHMAAGAERQVELRQLHPRRSRGGRADRREGT